MHRRARRWLHICASLALLYWVKPAFAVPSATPDQVVNQPASLREVGQEPQGAYLIGDNIVIPMLRGDGDLPIALCVVKNDDWLKRSDKYDLFLRGPFKRHSLSLIDDAPETDRHTLRVREVVVQAGYRDAEGPWNPSLRDVATFRAFAGFKQNNAAFDLSPSATSDKIDYTMRNPVSLFSAKSLAMLKADQARLLLVTETYVVYPIRLEIDAMPGVLPTTK